MMAIHLVVDGYNLIRQSAILSAKEGLSLEHGRQALLERLRQYKLIRGHRITVVFDGANKLTLAEERSQEKGIKTVYSRQGESADSVIKRMCRHEGEKLLVVTSDRELARYVEKYGSVVMGSEDFEAKIEMAFYRESKGVDEGEEEGWSPDRGTRKKGPARRPSKKERKRRQKWKKL